MRNLAKPEKRKREQVFLVMLAVDEDRYVSDCARALATLKKAGYTARPLSHDVLHLVAEDPESVPQFQEIGEPYDPPPAS